MRGTWSCNRCGSQFDKNQTFAVLYARPDQTVPYASMVCPNCATSLATPGLRRDTRRSSDAIEAEAQGATTRVRREIEGLGDRELIRAVRSEGSCDADRAREVLTERYQPLVIGQSAKLHRSRGPDHEDVVSVAQHGLQKAIADYDLDHGAPFAAYAKAKVRGEMMRWFRDDRYTVHVPRPLHERFMQVRRAAAQLEADLHREPDVEEVAQHLDCSVSEVLEAMAVRSAQRSRVDQLTSRIGGTEMLDAPDPDLAAALASLDERDKLLLYRRFWDGCSQREIGEELGVSQAHVSRLEKRALDELQELVRPRPAGIKA